MLKELHMEIVLGLILLMGFVGMILIGLWFFSDS